MADKDRYVAEITFLDGTTRTFRYERFVVDGRDGSVSLCKRDADHILSINPAATQTIEMREATDDD